MHNNLFFDVTQILRINWEINRTQIQQWVSLDGLLRYIDSYPNGVSRAPFKIAIYDNGVIMGLTREDIRYCLVFETSKLWNYIPG